MELKVRVLLSKGPGAGAGRTVAMTQLEEKLKFVTRFGTKWQAFIGKIRMNSCTILFYSIPVFRTTLNAFLHEHVPMNLHKTFHINLKIFLDIILICYGFIAHYLSSRLSSSTSFLRVLRIRGKSFVSLRCRLFSTQRTHGTRTGTTDVITATVSHC